MDQATGEMKRGRSLLHQRAYEIDSVLEDDQHFRLIGHIRDVKPDGLWNIDDDEPVTIHHMELQLVVHAATLVITDMSVQMHVHPQTQCPDILPSYEQVVGWSIARGFTQKVKDAFGGPRACTHIGALLNAMAPVAIQSMWGFMQLAASGSDDGGEQQARSRGQEMNRNTCHVWAENGPMFALLAAGEPVPMPIWAKERLEKKGLPADRWVE